MSFCSAAGLPPPHQPTYLGRSGGARRVLHSEVPGVERACEPVSAVAAGVELDRADGVPARVSASRTRLLLGCHQRRATRRATTPGDHIRRSGWETLLRVATRW